MGMAIEQVSETNALANQLAAVNIDGEGRLEFLERLLLNQGSVLETVISATPTGSVLDQVVAKTAENSREAREKRIGFVGRAILAAMVESPGADLPSAKDTMWGAVNGVTFYADHLAKSFSESNRVYNSWFGGNNKLKTDAMQVAVQMAGLHQQGN